MKKTSTDFPTSTSTATTTPESARPSHEDIAQKAYELWLQDGCPMGRSVYHWHEAERQLWLSKQNSEPVSTPRESNERSLASLTDDSSPYSGLEKEVPASTKGTRDFAKKS